MNNELERMWKEAVVTILIHYLGVCLEGLSKSTKVSARTAVSLNMQSTKQEC
jgi:hypothetical protein